MEEIARVVTEYADAVNSLTLNVSKVKNFVNFYVNFLIQYEFLQLECTEDMGGVVDKLRSLKHNISGVVEPTQQLFNKFVIEESLK